MPNADHGGALLTPNFGFPRYSVDGCAVGSHADALNYDDPKSVMLGSTGEDLDERYLPAMTAGLRRLELIGKTEGFYVIYIAGPAYAQCQFDVDGKQFYCEASSAEAGGKPIERILTPERRAKLAEAGFEPPGRVMNYSRLYPRSQYDAAAVAKALLHVLIDSYGYQGAPEMTVKTELSDDEVSLAPIAVDRDRPEPKR
jgi:hypothetical protein